MTSTQPAWVQSYSPLWLLLANLARGRFSKTERDSREELDRTDAGCHHGCLCKDVYQMRTAFLSSAWTGSQTSISTEGN
jgi:hypothetical protein